MIPQNLKLSARAFRRNATISTTVAKHLLGTPCRQPGPSTAVLEVDYSVYCSDPDFTPRAGSLGFFIVVPVGFPVTLLGLLGEK